MKLIITRHGIADNSKPDFERNLTEEGRIETVKQTRIIQSTGWRITDIRTSPLNRTVQTGSVIQSELSNLSGQNVKIIPEVRLSPGIDVTKIDDLITSYQTNDTAIWIFHMPDVARVAAYILNQPESQFYFTPGTMLALNLPVPAWKGRSMMIWMMQPEYMPD
jgi:phosphohistidine phosphatase